MNTQELLSRQSAAEWLAQRLKDKNATQWALWLRNNGNSARRAAYRMQVEQVGRNAFYQLEELEKFAEFEKQRNSGAIKLTGRAAAVLQAYGTGTSSGTAYGRRWKGASANPSNGNDGVFVQAVLNEPLLVFAMTPDQAIEFGTELTEAGKAAKHINSQQPQEPDLGRYQTVLDNLSVQIKRKNDDEN